MLGGAGERGKKDGNGDEPDSYVLHVGDPKEKGTTSVDLHHEQSGLTPAS
jgi:hypothetical protein